LKRRAVMNINNAINIKQSKKQPSALSLLIENMFVKQTTEVYY